MTWDDALAIISVAAGLAGYLYYIHNQYPRNLTSKLERDYYTCYDITVLETAPDSEGGPELFDRFEEHDPGDEQPQR